MKEWRVILYYTGRTLFGFALLMVVPALVGLVEGDFSSVAIFVFSAGLTATFAQLLSLAVGRPERQLEWKHGLAIVALTWLLATLFGAVPDVLSGYYLSYLDAVFDVMSGFTTTGLTLIQHPDTISDALNTWRFLLTYVGGQGIIVMALVFFVNEVGAFKIYAGEGKDERLLPNVRNTAREIWRISLTYLVIGSLLLSVVLWFGGLAAPRAVLNGVWMFMSAWSTGGFAPHSENLLYYHNAFFEYAATGFAVLGSLNFAFHHALWQGKWKEIRRNLEFLTFVFTLNFLWIFVAVGLIKTGAYNGLVSLMRIGYLELVSAHTTTGFMSVYAGQLAHSWGNVALIGLTVAMMLGGSDSSTAGGFKALRIGILWKALVLDVRRFLLPESAVVRMRFHHISDVLLTDERVKAAALIIILYLITWAIGSMTLLLYGYPLGMSLFEAASATANAGLSTGVTSAAMPWVIKVVFTLMMWMGRLEFLSVFVFFSYIVRGVFDR